MKDFNLDDAVHLMLESHGEQRRKYTDELYYHHPIRVAETIAKAGFNKEFRAAAYLHDVLEDTTCTPADIVRATNLNVLNTVRAISNLYPHSAGNRRARNAMYNRQLVRSYAAQTIKYADIMDNVPSIVAHDSKFAVTYIEEQEERLRVACTGSFTLYHKAAYLLRDQKALLGIE